MTKAKKKVHQLVVNLLKLEAVISEIEVSVHLLDPCKVGMGNQFVTEI